MVSISLIGRPNVGKSSLFNVLSKSRKALVADIPGLTRDRNYTKLTINDKPFWLIDTGGFEPKNKDNIYFKMSEQTKIAIDESDCIFFVVDGRTGYHSIDGQIADYLRKKNKLIYLLINKTEGLDSEIVYSDFAQLGFKKYLCVSATHREGIASLQDIFNTLDYDENELIEDESIIKLSIVGKPNVGKSTLINSLVGEERFIAIDRPGTTRDAISTNFKFKNNSFLITDTAGIRRKGKVIDVIEKFSVLKAINAIESSNVCIIVIDATEDIGHQDLQILGYILEEQKPFVIAINKWDKLSDYDKSIVKNSLDKRLSFITNIERVFISASKKVGLSDLLKHVMIAYTSSCKKFSTPILNSFLHDIQTSHQPPIVKGIRPKLKFAHQGGSNPPNIIIHGNHLTGIKKDYIKFIESSLIKTFNLIGTPLIINLKEGHNPYIKKDAKPSKVGLVTRRKIINEARKRISLKKKKIN